ncbi:hypothetical protein [Campylobacter pinnipediorum]|uniref:hypothetical protein n=1 Tax=Campylobacter pinnipediorum TaxID=1965231 RepID=UPI00084CE7EE|nr:hypothetical protein [Campylobacter pinnipediorum]
MKLSHVACTILCSAVFSSSLYADIDKKIINEIKGSEIINDLNKYLINNKTELTNVFGSFSNGVKSVNSDSLNTGGQYAQLGTFMKKVLKDLTDGVGVQSNFKGGDYNNQNEYKWLDDRFIASSKNLKLLVSDDNLRLTVRQDPDVIGNGWAVYIRKGENQDKIKLNGENLVIKKAKGNGVITNEAGLSAAELSSLKEPISKGIDNFPSELPYLIDEYYYLAKNLIENGDQELSNKEEVVSILNKIKNYGTIDEIFDNKLKSQVQELRNLKKLKSNMQNIQTLVNNIGDNNPSQEQVDEINKYLRDNDLVFILDKKAEKSKDYYDGVEEKVSIQNFNNNKAKIKEAFKEFFDGYKIDSNNDTQSIDIEINNRVKELKEIKKRLKKDKEKFIKILEKLGVNDFVVHDFSKDAKENLDEINSSIIFQNLDKYLIDNKSNISDAIKNFKDGVKNANSQSLNSGEYKALGDFIKTTLKYFKDGDSHLNDSEDGYDSNNEYKWSDGRYLIHSEDLSLLVESGDLKLEIRYDPDDSKILKYDEHIYYKQR